MFNYGALSGAGVDVYVIDTGIEVLHPEVCACGCAEIAFVCLCVCVFVCLCVCVFICSCACVGGILHVCPCALAEGGWGRCGVCSLPAPVALLDLTITCAWPPDPLVSVCPHAPA